ncbi:hypothetical protein K0M31_018440 [Melipona bicolor]|uniref:EB domain-containing protein n=1 Tax=Melipona bicolor TaxID=60889 RepID=A0AA40G3G1_9HYME|nr:hypothetical protein K0M31_018440 [Melipona bicolor]
MKMYLFLLLIVATTDRAVTEDIDPPIPCVDVKTCIEVLNSSRGLFCQNGYCLCENNGHIKNCSSNNITHIIRNIGSTFFHVCKTDKDCTVNHTFCNTTMSQCDCQRDYILSNNKKECLKKAETINFSCTESKQCSVFLPNTICENNHCVCIPGYHRVKNVCYKTIDMGGSCTRHEECSHVHDAVCTNNDVCACPGETVISENRKRCLKVARDILDECVENVQCTQTFEKAVCVNQTCHCEDQYHFEPEMKRCFNNRGLDETCGNTFDCYQDENENVTSKALKCEKNVCVCAENYEREYDKCVNGGSLLPVLSIFLLCIVIYADLAI